MTTAQTTTDMQAYEVTPNDAQFFDKHLHSFVPPNSFDVHCHLVRTDMQGDEGIPFVQEGPVEVGYKQFVDMTQRWMGDLAPLDGLFFALPRPTMDVQASNDFNRDQARLRPDSRWLHLIRPDDDPADAERQVLQPQCCGFKVYHVFAPNRDVTFDAEIDEFLPRWAWEIADRHNLAIMLHMVKRHALADENNQRVIRECCERYPGARLILAHAARGFNGKHTVWGIDSLRGLDNVYFDTSVVCESEPFEAILKTFGPTRLMFGGDFPFTEIIGRNVSLGDGFFWLYKNNANYKEQQSLARPTIIGNESLLAVKLACRNLGLNDSDVERIFCHNARELLGITSHRDDKTGQKLYEKAKKLIPGGAQLFGKRQENYAPGQWPAYFAEARGCETVDLDANHYTDMSMCGIGATLLGYADPDVTAAVTRRINLGSMCTLNPADEVELAELLMQIHPWADMARFGRMGGETMAMAIRIARARTRRDGVAFCGYHGWHDWYLAANLGENDALGGYHLMNGLPPVGVPSGLAGTMHPFNYNDIDGLKRVVDQHGSELAAIVMEPTRSTSPKPGFLEGVRELADQCGAKLVMDEVSIGWRLCLGGAHLKYGINPDIAVYAKTLGNGHPITAVIGNADTMQAAQDTFMSSALWTEAVGPAAAVATLRKMMRIDVPTHIAKIGQATLDGLTALAKTHGVPLGHTGHPGFIAYAFDHPKAAALQTLWTVRMLNKGFLVSGNFYPTLSHEMRHVNAFVAACEEVFAELGAAIKNDDIEDRIGGPVKHSGFGRLN